MHELLPYLMAVIGFLVVYVLNGIKGELKEVKTQLIRTEDALHLRVTEADRRHQKQFVELDRRLGHVEARCSILHSGREA